MKDLDLVGPKVSEKNRSKGIGDVLTEMLHSNSPFAKSYRKHLALNEIDAKKGGMV